MRFHRSAGLDSKPRVSVVIPCYNYGHYLPDAVASALDQRGVDVDILIVDDASTDGSAEVAERLAASDPRIELLVHEVNRGHIRTYNDGLERATGDYVVLLSADDRLTPDSLSRSVALMEHHPDVVLVYGYAIDFEHEVPDTRAASAWWSTWSGDEWLSLISSRGRNIIVNPEAVMRTAVMNDLGGYRTEHPHAADMEVWMRAALRGRVGRVNGPVQAAYRVHGTNMHMTTYGGLKADAQAVVAVFDSFFGPGGEGRSMPDARRVHALARRAVAREAWFAARRPTTSARESAELLELALATSPELSRSVSWKIHGWVQTLVRPSWSARVERLQDIRWAVRWRRWRRFGT